MDALILSCGTGGGHNAAGAAIKEELIKRGYNVKFFNPYALKSNMLARVIDRAYVGLVQKAPNVFGVVYKIGNAYRKLPFHSPVYYANGRIAAIIEDYIQKNKCDIIIMPHLFPAEIITQMKRKGYELPPTVFVGTDYTCIPFTEETECDYYVIPAKDLEKEYIKRGIKKEKLRPFGIPVREVFDHSINIDEAKLELGLSVSNRYILVSGGSIGAGNVEKVVKNLSDYYEKTNVKLIIICGNNKKLLNKLKDKYSEKCILIGHTNDIAKYMMASNLIIGKPGGLSSTEAAVVGKPFIHITPIPGCETYNMRYFYSKGMSIPVKRITEKFGKICDKTMEEDNKKKMICQQKNNISANARILIGDMADELCKIKL